jgi:predicted O-methyltransferase YrrM
MRPGEWLSWKFRRFYIGELSRIGRMRHLRAVLDTAGFVEEHMPRVHAYADRRALLRAALGAVTVDGLFCEFGVFRGESLNYLARLAPAHILHGFDSFEGLPEDWRTGYHRGLFRTAIPKVQSNVRLHVGWFADTLPAFLEETDADAAFLHVDADLYSSTHEVLESLQQRIVPGTVIVFDDFFNFPGWREGEYRAFREYVDAAKARYEFLGYCECGQQVAVRILATSDGEIAVPLSVDTRAAIHLPV